MIELLIIIIASAVLSTEIAYNSDLAYQLKKFLLLDEKRPTVNALSKWSFYLKLMGTIAYILSPLIIVTIVLLRLYVLFIKLLNCPYCISFHITWLNVLYFTDISFPNVFLYGLVGIATTHIYERYMMNG